MDTNSTNLQTFMQSTVSMQQWREQSMPAHSSETTVTISLSQKIPHEMYATELLAHVYCYIRNML